MIARKAVIVLFECNVILAALPESTDSESVLAATDCPVAVGAVAGAAVVL